MSTRNQALATHLAAFRALAAVGPVIIDGSGNIIKDFYAENPPQKEEPQRTRYGGQKERERRAKRLAASKGA